MSFEEHWRGEIPQCLFVSRSSEYIPEYMPVTAAKLKRSSSYEHMMRCTDLRPLGILSLRVAVDGFVTFVHFASDRHPGTFFARERWPTLHRRALDGEQQRCELRYPFAVR